MVVMPTGRPLALAAIVQAAHMLRCVAAPWWLLDGLDEARRFVELSDGVEVPKGKVALRRDGFVEPCGGLQNPCPIGRRAGREQQVG